MANKTKIIFCCKNNYLFTFGKYKESKGCFETVFDKVFKGKDYHCSYTYYFPSDDKKNVEVILGNNMDSKNAHALICEQTLESAIKPLVEYCDSDLYFFVDHRLVVSEDNLLGEIVKSKNLKQLCISATRMPVAAEEYIKEHNYSFKGTPLKLAIFDYSDLSDSVEFFERAFKEIATGIDGQSSQNKKSETESKQSHKSKEPLTK